MNILSHKNFPLGQYVSKLDRVMARVRRITDDIAHMPLAVFIFRDNEIDEVNYSIDNRSGKI